MPVGAPTANHINWPCNSSFAPERKSQLGSNYCSLGSGTGSAPRQPEECGKSYVNMVGHTDKRSFKSKPSLARGQAGVCLHLNAECVQQGCRGETSSLGPA